MYEKIRLNRPPSTKQQKRQLFTEVQESIQRYNNTCFISRMGIMRVGGQDEEEEIDNELSMFVWVESLVYNLIRKLRAADSRSRVKGAYFLHLCPGLRTALS